MEKGRAALALNFRPQRGVESERQKRKRNSSSLSYVAAISLAILSSPRQRLPLSDIYSFIEEHFPEFIENRVRWKNTVRHNLSLHDCFVRGEVASNKKGCNWRIHPSFVAEFSRGDFSRHKLSQSPTFSWPTGYQATTSYSASLVENPAVPCYSYESTCRLLISAQFWSPSCQTKEIRQPHYTSYLPWISPTTSDSAVLD
ncbi:forkhead box protein L1-like [Montipora foliosa]|uniref:forkhead box protein L1-like n=1 Tax=Montipora foliosa TaxID=591990 RepID=UPI0035F157E5